MTEAPETDRRPRWRKKRWRIAAAARLSLPLLYAAGDGPVLYAVYRGWVPFRAWSVPYEWTRRGFLNGSVLAKPYGDYIAWWARLGLFHGSPLGPPPPDC